MAATRVVNTLPLESYLRGVVPRESIASWGDAAGGRGMQALAAQAVAARSYVLTERHWTYAQTCDTIACQVYGGAAKNGTRLEDPRSDFAVSVSAGVVRVRGGAVARTEFASSSGGWTTGTAFGHVHDYGDVRSPYSSWRVDLAGTTIAAKYPQIGQFLSLVVTRRTGEGVQGGRVLAMDVVGSDRPGHRDRRAVPHGARPPIGMVLPGATGHRGQLRQASVLGHGVSADVGERLVGADADLARRMDRGGLTRPRVA